MYKIQTTKQFDKGVVRCIKRGLDISKLHKVMSILELNGCLPAEYKPHKLKGYKSNCTWECHIEPDWLLVWNQHDNELILLMVATGTHADLF